MSKTILIVEDNEKNRLLVADVLKFHGYDILEAEDGAKGLKMAEEKKPALILLDIQMPVLDGYEFIKKIREKDALKNIRVIAVTSFAMKGDREKILAIGADDYISKPINTRELPKLVEKYIGPAKG